MPNHVSNCWKITGPVEEIHAFLTKWKDSKNPFDSFLPMPEELRKVVTGCNTIDGVKCTRWTTAVGPDGEQVDVPITEETIASFKEKFGASDWYEWANRNWGTKWGAYECREPEITSENNGVVTSYLYFDTAWSPPFPAVESLSRCFPHWEIEGAYVEQGCDFIGTFSVDDGVIADNCEPLSSYRNLPDISNMTEEEEEEEMDNFYSLDIVDRYNGFALEVFEEYPCLHEGG